MADGGCPPSAVRRRKLASAGFCCSELRPQSDTYQKYIAERIGTAEGGRKGTRALGCAAPSGGKAAKAAGTRDALFCMRRCVGLIESTATDRLVWPWRVLRSTQRCPCARCSARDVWEETLDHTVTCEDPEFWSHASGVAIVGIKKRKGCPCSCSCTFERKKPCWRT